MRESHAVKGARVEETPLMALRRRTLLYHLLSPWRRRGASLLQVGLGSGLLPDFFWEAGFDTSALDAELEQVDAARARTGPKVEYSLGQPNYLPFDDGTFDYVVLTHLGLRNRKDAREWMAETLHEAVRVAGRGVIILEWNRLSWPVSREQRKAGVWPLQLIWQARKVCPDGGMAVRTIMPVPQRTYDIKAVTEARKVESKPDARLETRTDTKHETWHIDAAMRTGRLPRKLSSPKSGWDRFLRYVPPTLGGHSESLANRINKRALPLPFGAIVGLRIEKSPLLFTPVGAIKVSGVKEASASYAGDTVMNRPAHSQEREKKRTCAEGQ